VADDDELQLASFMIIHYLLVLQLVRTKEDVCLVVMLTKMM